MKKSVKLFDFRLISTHGDTRSQFLGKEQIIVLGKAQERPSQKLIAA
jgi:hypothetical protein